MTFREWLEGSGAVARTLTEHRGLPYSLQVFSEDRGLWNLSDYAVSSVVSGPSVILIRKESPRS